MRQRLLRISHILVVLALVTCLAPSTLAQSAITISVGEHAPWCGKKLHHNGYYLHIISEAFSFSGIKVNYEYSPWSRAYEQAVSGKTDATAFWHPSKDRDKDSYFSVPLDVTTNVFFHVGRNAMPEWETLMDLRGLRIGATLGYTYTKEFWDLAESGELDVQLTHSDEINMKKLLQGRLDLVLCEPRRGMTILKGLKKAVSGRVVTYDAKPLKSSTIHVLFPKIKPNSLELLRAFNDGFEKLKKSDLYKTIKTNLEDGVYDAPAP